MKATGIIRRVDDLGRICLPKELRKAMNLNPDTAVEVFTTPGGIVLKPYKENEIDLDLIAKVLDNTLGELNYTLYDVDGVCVLPKGFERLTLDFTKDLPTNTEILYHDGEMVGYLTSPSGNRVVAGILVAELIADPYSPN